MSRYVFWAAVAVNAVFVLLVGLSLPFGPDLLYWMQGGSLVLAVALMGRQQHGGDEPLSPPPPSHPAWRNPRA